MPIINALIFSKPFYCSNLWINTSKPYINKLQAIQSFRRSYCDRHVSTQLYLRTAIMAFKCPTGRVPEYLLSQLITRIKVSRRTTRNSQKLNIPLFKAANGQRTFYYRIVITWNSLHSSLKTINSMPIFKYSPKHELLEDFIDS